MRTNIDIDDDLMADAQKASGFTTKKQTVEEALRLMIRLRRQQDVGAAFGKFRWRGNLDRSRRGRGTAWGDTADACGCGLTRNGTAGMLVGTGAAGPAGIGGADGCGSDSFCRAITYNSRTSVSTC